MQQTVHAFLKERDTTNRVFMPTSKNGLFECLSQHVFKVNLKDFQKIFTSFMQGDDEKVLFKSILQLLDNTGHVPIKGANESDESFKTKLDNCYDCITKTCSDIHPYSDFLHVYVFAIATLIGRPIYILHEDETGDLSWSYFPSLYEHSYELGRDKAKYTAMGFITMCFSTGHCYMIDSSRCLKEKPNSYGCIDVYERRLKGHLHRFVTVKTAILMRKEITQSCVLRMAQRIQLTEVRTELQGSLTVRIITRSVQLYQSRLPRNVYSRTLVSTLPESILGLHPNKKVFVELLLSDNDMLTCLFEVTVEIKKCHSILKIFDSTNDFLPTKFHKNLQELKDSFETLKLETSEFVTRCRTVEQELKDRREKTNIAVIGGSAVGIIGGGLTIAGLILTPFTFGASLGLTVAGASLGVAGGIAGGTARVVEGVKQNSTIDEINVVQTRIASLEKEFVKCIGDIETIFHQNETRNLGHDVKGPGINKKAFLAVGSAFRTLHAPVAVAVAFFRLGAFGATLAASVLGPVSLVLDVGFLAEAAHDLTNGCQTGAGQILQNNAKSIEMKLTFFMCMLRGNN